MLNYSHHLDMARVFHNVLTGIGIGFVMSGQVVAETAGLHKPEAARTHLFRQADGSVVERLRDAPLRATVYDFAGPQSWWDAILEPRAMTALAVLPGVARGAGQKLPELVDPGLVRNWAELVDPQLALRWTAQAGDNGFAKAMLRVPAAGISMAYPFVHWSLGRGAAMQNAWRNALGVGASRSSGGQVPSQEWLTLPAPSPRDNPWLSSLSTYRY